MVAFKLNWHAYHIMCNMCKKDFRGVFFIADDGMPYCERHYYEVQGQWCSGCEGPIISGKMVKMGNKSYHTEHFFCTYRKEKLAGREYYEHKGDPYCKPCYLELF